VRQLLYINLALYTVILIGVIVADALGRVPHEQALHNVTTASSLLIVGLSFMRVGAQHAAIAGQPVDVSDRMLITVKGIVFAVVTAAFFISDVFFERVATTDAVPDVVTLGGTLLVGLNLTELMPKA